MQLKKEFNKFLGKRMINIKLWCQSKVQNSMVVQNFKEFCSNTSIHGMRYWVDRKCHWTERIWWIVAFALSVFLCLSFVHTRWLKWIDNPVMISMDHRSLHVSTVPFPAATICPVVKNKADIFNFTSVYRSLAKINGKNMQRTTNKTELEYMKAAFQICENWIGSEMPSFFSEDNFTDNSILTRISEMAPTFDDTMILCKLFNVWSDCGHFLTPIYTESGLCYTFNSMNLNDILTNEVVAELKDFPSVRNASKWCPEDGYDNVDDTEIYPYRAFGLGRRESFRVMLKVLNRDIDYLCGSGFNGYKITFHLPNELPPMWKKRYHVSAEQAGFFLVAAKLVLTSPALRNYAPAVRQCYFNTERNLRFFRSYTQQNCEAECLSNFTLSLCGCVHFAMPRTKTMNICGTQKFGCLLRAENDLFNSDAVVECDCLPSCSTLHFDIELNLATNYFYESFSLSRLPQPPNFENSTFGRVSVTFRDENVDVSKRIEFHSVTDFLASSGGLFGLFMGASLLSLVELVYFFTLRPFCTQQQHTKNGPKTIHIKMQPAQNK